MSDPINNDNPITTFVGVHFFLSNFSPINMKVDGIWYPTLEHAYQASKTNSVAHRKMIAKQPTAGKAKRLGRLVPLVDGWDEMRIEVMLELLRYKFHEPAHMQSLLDTGEREIIHYNSWGDAFWGVDRKSGRGENNLGKLLMQVRGELQLEKVSVER